jgi:SHS2 domain-containing protein
LRGHRQIEHTADIALEVWAPSQEELLEEAAQALVEIMTEGAEIPSEAERSLVLDCFDREDRLVRWLNEVIFLAVDSGFILQSAELRLDGENRLSAKIRGTERAGLLTGELKSVTYHDLSLRDDFARFVVDV